MRLSQILKESDNADEIMSALSSMASVLRSKGHSNIPMQYVVKYLNSMGLNVDPESLINIASQSPFIKNATMDTLEIGSEAEQGVDAMGDGGIEQDVVGDMALDAAKGDLS